MKLFGFTKLSAKLAALYLVIIGATLVGIFSALATREYFAQRRNLVADLQELIRTQSLPVTTALWELDIQKIDTFLEEVGKLPFVQGAVVTDSKGTLVADIGDISAPPKSADFTAEAPLVFGIGANPQMLGTIKIVVHDREILSAIKDRLANDGIVLLVLLVVLIGTTVLVTNAIVGRPLMLLQASIEKIRQGGARERVEWAASDELGKVFGAFNNLQSAQEESEQALKQARNDLELRVDERTAELQETNEAVLAEIKERKRAEEALRESEARAKAILNTVSQLQGLLRPDGTLIEINAAALAMIGAGEEDVVGLPFWDCPWWTHDSDLQTRLRQALKRAADGETVHFMATHPATDGTEHIINFRATPVRGENGEVTLIVPEGDDITYLKQTEEALRESESRAKAILNTATHLQGLLKPDGTLIEANAAALSMIEASKEDVSGRPFWDCPWWTHNPELQARLRKALKRAADGETVNFLATHPAADGTEHIINFSATPVRDENGEVALIVPEGHDITELKQAEAELRQAKEQAEAALAELTKTQQQLVVSEKMASLGQLTAGIAHEIKNPLNFVNNFSEVSAELLGELRQAIEPARQALNEEQRDELDELITTLSANMVRIDEQGRRADSIVKNMLQHARDGGSERRPIDVNTFLEENLNLVYHGARAKDQTANIALERDFDPDAGSINVAVQDISRVLLNLFGNGIHALRQRQRLETAGGYAPVLHVSSRDCGDRVEIRVRDNGIGIPEHIVNKIFDPFFTTKPPGEGTGLGLSLSYDTVVQQHGGSLRVESEEDRFTEFVLVLPRDPVPHAKAAP